MRRFLHALDEFEYWIQLLALELHRNAERRYLLALGRLCELFAEKVSRDKKAPPDQLARRMRLSTDWLDLQRILNGNRPAPPAPGKLRLIQGGRAQTEPTRR